MKNRVVNGLKMWNRILLAAAMFVVAVPMLGDTVVPIAQSSSRATPAPQEAGKNGVSYPSCAYCPRPKYSDEALRAGFEGDVRLQATITTEGRAINIKVVNSPGLGLDKQAVDVLKQWKFKPALGPDGKAVDADTQVDVAFHLPKKGN